jgi:hypothetical protein
VQVDLEEVLEVPSTICAVDLAFEDPAHGALHDAA